MIDPLDMNGKACGCGFGPMRPTGDDPDQVYCITCGDLADRWPDGKPSVPAQVLIDAGNTPEAKAAVHNPQPRAILPAKPDSPHNWPTDAYHENGNYQCKCGICKTMFIGHKRRVVCKVCFEQGKTTCAQDVTKDMTEETKPKFTARVTLTLEVNCTQPWNEEEQLNEVYKQALREASARIHKLLEGQKEIRVVRGSDKVEAVMVPKQ